MRAPSSSVSPISLSLACARWSLESQQRCSSIVYVYCWMLTGHLPEGGVADSD